ncbi:MAG: polymorphic toxin type 50 domain-containing protein [Candidatus Rhabdochlamydia sp.]
MEVFSTGYALLATQCALLDEITPELRAVIVDVCKEEKLLYMRIYYEGEASEKRIDLWDCVITEASADLGINCVLDNEVERIDYPQEIPSRGRYAYLRREPNMLSQNVSEVPIIITREIKDFKEKIGVFISPVSEEKVSTSWGVIHTTKDESHIIPAKPASYKIKEITPIAYALLSIQRALLGLATPELRGIVADIQDQELYIRFYYDKGVSYEIFKSWEFAITKVIADMGSDYLFDTGIERLDYPQEIPFRGRYAYLRKE